MSKNTFFKFIETPTAKLAATYLAIIMLMSLSFSVMIYNASANQLGRPMPPATQETPSMGTNTRPFDEQVRNAIEKRFTEARDAVLFRLIWLNLFVLVAGSGVSYVLARRSLKPIEEAMDAQTQFVSDASHELRTPLTILQTTNEVALRKQKLNIKDARELITHNIEEVKKLRELSDSLLDLLKTDKSIPLASVNLQDAVTESLQHIVKVAQQKNISIEDSVPRLNVQSNKLLLSRVVTILLDNAIKYSENEKVIRITAKQVGEKIYLHIEDNGIGIKASDLPYIFRRFYRADKSRSAIGVSGYGLGLSIADKIAGQLNAQLSVESTAGEGSTFTLVLPS